MQCGSIPENSWLSFHLCKKAVDSCVLIDSTYYIRILSSFQRLFSFIYFIYDFNSVYILDMNIVYDEHCHRERI